MAITRLNNNSITSITALPSGVGGDVNDLTLITSISSSSSVSSITVDNVFTSSYDHYLCKMTVKLGTVGGYYLRLLKSDGTERASTYYTADLRHNMNSGAIQDGGSSINVSTYYIGRGGGADLGSNTEPTSHELRFMNPYTSTICTTMFNNSWGYHDDQNNRFHFISSSRNESAETHRGFKLVANAGSFTSHNIQIWGYTNA